MVRGGGATLVEVSKETYALIAFAARMAGVPEGDIVARAMTAYVDLGAAPQGDQADPWQPVPVYAVYGGRRVTGEFVPANQRLLVTSEPVAGQAFKTPSGAARAVVAAWNPGRPTLGVNGWAFWKVAGSDDRIEVLRKKPPRGR